MPNTCRLCRRTFATPESLRVHITIHRQEMEMLRFQHEALTARQQTSHDSSKQTPRDHHGDHGIDMIPLAPNHAFWEPYRKAGQLPPVIDFMGVGNPMASEKPSLQLPQELHHQDDSFEDTISDPLMSSLRGEEEGDEGHSEP
ncbi:hypothetical protein OPV22_021723 [Ensete ventricosum]|uniref:C2H2-type domain-containing protein n=1 Tax=Ensete ventricosum TaxID=4639 RepID=A0AAV8PB56_ENSVE|nr:hypothetical protein OPV22_021723 [Ensete ventricosum]